MRGARRFRQKLALTTACALMASASLNSAQAQSIDYTAMEDLFGEPVTTSANGSPQRVSDVALSMDILNAEDIATTGAKSIPEILRFLPGIDVRRHSYGQYEVGIRGYNQGSSERILVLVNGRQVYTDFFGQVVWDNLPVEISDIKQIEVVKGPNTALFGFNAVSGVINIITYNPLYDDVKELNLSGGSHGYHSASGTLTHKFADNKIGIRLSGGANNANQDFEDIENPPETISAGSIKTRLDDTEKESIAFDVWTQLTDNVQAHIEVTKNDHVRNEYLVTHVLSTSEYDTSSLRGRILADTSWGLVEADIYHNETRANYDMHLSSGETPLEVDNRITVAKLNNTFQVGTDHIFRLAGEYRAASNIFSSPTARLDQSDLTYDIASGSALWDWRATDKLRTSAAIRYDYFDMRPDGDAFVAPGTIGALNPNEDADYHQKREEISYNLGLSYKMDAANSLKASYSRGADLPSFTEMGLQFFTPASTSPNSAIYGNPNTDTSIVTNYEIGYEHEIEGTDSIVHSAVFYQESDEMQAFQSIVTTGGAADMSHIGNIGDSKMYGIELGIEGLYRKQWDWDLNYSYIRVNDDIRNAQNAAQRSSFSTYEDSTASHIFNAHIGYRANQWRADLFGQYKTDFKDIYDEDQTTNNQYELREVNDQVIINANFAYDLTDYLTWSVSGPSIVGDRQQSVESDAEQTVWTTLKFHF